MMFSCSVLVVLFINTTPS